MQKLKESGYTEVERFYILKGGMKTHENLKRLESEGKRDYYRTPEQRKKDKDNSKGKDNDWYKSGNEKLLLVMFVETTPNGELINMLRQVEEKYKIDEDKRIKFVEKCGRKIINQIRVADPFRENCTEDECIACQNSSKFTNCRKMNIGYELQCKLCKERGKEKVYIGESSRNLFLRGKEHEKLYRKENKNSVIWKHVKSDHEEEKEKVKFEMKMTGCFSKPLQRITEEGIRIKNRKPEELLNSKNEFYGPSVKRKTYT